MIINHGEQTGGFARNLVSSLRGCYERYDTFPLHHLQTFRAEEVEIVNCKQYSLSQKHFNFFFEKEMLAHVYAVQKMSFKVTFLPLRTYKLYLHSGTDSWILFLQI